MRKRNGVRIRGSWVLVCLVVAMGAAGAPAARGAGFYMEAGAGTVTLNPPERDTLPFYETDGFALANGRVQADLDFDEDRTDLAGTVTLGYRSPGTGGADWLGSGTRVQLASTFFSADGDDQTIPAAPSGFPEGYLLGMYFSDRGMEGVAVLGRADILGNVEVPAVRQSADFDFADFQLTLATDYTVLGERLVLSPRVGLVYAFFNQAYGLSAETPDSLAPFLVGGQFQYTSDERLDAQYAGISLGLDGRIPLGAGVSLLVGGAVMPLYSHTDMDLDYQGRAWPGIDLRTEVRDSDNDFTFRAVGRVELGCEVERLTVTLGAAVDYWDAVPVVEYPEFPVAGFNAITGLSPRAPEIDYDHMVNVLATFKLAVAF